MAEVRLTLRAGTAVGFRASPDY